MGPETAEHINVVNWFHYQFPELADDFHHFANERRTSLANGRLLKRMGVKKGVADFFLALPLNGKSGLWIELKVNKNKATNEQVQFLLRKSDRGYEAKVVWGFEQTKNVILDYLHDYIPLRSEKAPKNLFNGKPIC